MSENTIHPSNEAQTSRVYPYGGPDLSIFERIYLSFELDWWTRALPGFFYYRPG